MVVYRPLYNDSGWWVRPHAMFFGSLVVDGVERRRFTPIGSSEGESFPGASERRVKASLI